MRWLMASVLLLISSTALAEFPLYGELQAGVGGVQNQDLDFYPTFGTLSLGAYVLPNIGIELFADSGITEFEDEDVDFSIEEGYGFGVRFQSPPTRNLQGYIVLGAVNYTLEQQADSPGAATINEEFTGVRVSVGLMQRLVRFPNLLVTAEYRHYNADEPLRVDALVIGLRVNAP